MVQVAGLWLFGLDTNVLFYESSNWVSEYYFCNLFFLFCSSFYLVLVEGLLRHLWKFEVAFLSYILALCIEEWYMVFVVEFLLMKLVFNIFFVSAITFSIFWSYIIVPLGFHIFITLFLTSILLHVLLLLLRIPFLHFIFLLSTCPSKLNSCHLFPEISLTLPLCFHSSLNIPLSFFKLIVEHLVKAKHWVKHITSINLFNPHDNLML